MNLRIGNSLVRAEDYPVSLDRDAYKQSMLYGNFRNRQEWRYSRHDAHGSPTCRTSTFYGRGDGGPYYLSGLGIFADGNGCGIPAR